MRKFFILTYDDDEDQEVVTDYEMGDFDLTAFWNGERFRGRIPKRARLWVDRAKPTDYLANPISWVIVSDRLWEIVRPHVKGEVQTMAPPLYYEGTEERVPGFRLLNPLCSISAVKRKGDAIAQDVKLVVDRIPDGLHLFRLAEAPTTILISDFLRAKISGKGLKGFDFIDTYPVKG